MRSLTIAILGLSIPIGTVAFGVLSKPNRHVNGRSCARPLYLSDEPKENATPVDEFPEDFTEEEKVKAVGNLVADDEWSGLTMELAELVRLSIVEDIKANTREFIGKDDYKMGDISKEIDSRVKEEVANLRSKDEYELGDLSIALDTLSKELTCELTGKDEYEFGDLSKELDKRIKTAVADFCGSEEYQFGDLSKEIDRRVKERVAEFTGEGEYEFGAISREIDKRRAQWVTDFLGEEAAANYQFGDITKKLLSSYTGKDEYQFGDATKKFMGDLFGGKKKKGGDK